MRDLKIYSIYKVTVRIQIPFASICIAMYKYCPLYGPCKEMGGICGCVWVRVRICMDMYGYGYVQVQVLGIDLYWNGAAGRYGILNTEYSKYRLSYYIYHQLSSVLNF